ncbi:MAG: hypothetical protein JSW20_09940 [Nitrospiraceae bacterium]|nr:MAG: hypothetical protein JSW20_09940 [Nitrospiraceae bacterium]
MTIKTEKPSVNNLLKNEDVVKIIVDANRTCQSWREKLDWVRNIISVETFSLNEECLIYLAIYLRFIGTGEVACIEDGRHFRPCHHANSALRIEERLKDIASPSNAAISRKIYPWLPSHDSAFIRAEPLTRIRDIAHRNDIPKELKNEIKHSLQNKLHRCAGPEDLATSSALLERITSPGAAYSPSFVEQFRIFHEEMREFFNARSLEVLLRAIIRKGETEDTEHIIRFLEAKESGEDTPDHLVTVMARLTELRSFFLKRTETESGSTAQQFRLADIRLEDFAFVIVSRFMKRIDCLPENGAYWELTLYVLSLTVRNLFLSGINPEECSAIEPELNVLRQNFDASDNDMLLRLKASLDRCRRLCNGHTDNVLALFAERVETLGRSLGVDDHAIKLFCEGDIRNNLIFQLSKIVSALIKKIRKITDLSPWEALVTGHTAGRLVAAEHLHDMRDLYGEQVIAFLKKADGDEDIPEGIGGIILGHEMPHLSHIGVRARQRGVVLCICEDRDRFVQMEHLIGKQVDLDVTADEVNLEISSKGINSDATLMTYQSVQIQEISPAAEKRLLALEHVTLSNGGGKAWSARRLEEVSRISRSGFKTPPGVVVPFGVMEDAIQALQESTSRYRQLARELNGMPLHDFKESLQYLRNFIGQLKVNKELIHGIIETFGLNVRLMVRSSANCEDLKDNAGAGLYDSCANVSPSGLEYSILEVWSSLWTERAAGSRRPANIPHDRTGMAVLIQQMLTPELSFIMHTVNPVNCDPGEIYIELAVGMGETLASGAVRGSPYRMVCNKSSGEVRMLAFANFSHAIWPDKAEGLFSKIVDYTGIAMSTNAEIRKTLGNRLAGIGRFVEDAFGRPQDIEGVIIGNDIYLVQSRPQTGGVQG